MIETIDLTEYSFTFSDSEMRDLHKKNFIYGKNGTGKSSLVKAIQKQYSEDYDINLFNGWRGIISNSDRLNAISLGEENTLIQKKIEKVDAIILKLNQELLEPDHNNLNLFEKLKTAKSLYNKQNKKIQKIYTNAAREITTNLSLGRNYTSPNFQKDISKSNKLSHADKELLKKTINAERINTTEKLLMPTFDISKKIEIINNLLKTNITPGKIIEDIVNDLARQRFAKQGLIVHSRETDDSCAFCGNKISEHRWNDLEMFFSVEMKNFDLSIDELINNLIDSKKQITSFKIIDKLQYYPEFHDEIQQMNLKLSTIKQELQTFIEKTLTQLYIKKENPSITEELHIDEIPKELISIQPMYDDLYSRNQDYTEKLDKKQLNASNKLRYNEVNVMLDKYNFFENKDDLLKKEERLKVIQEEYSTLENEKKNKETERQELIKQSSSETSAALKVNKFLRGLGNDSFTLEHIHSNNEQNGQYRINDSSGVERSIQTLSDGEKNLVAFLWFMSSLEKVTTENNYKEKVVIFDDPMNSNDDNCQYLMIGLIQNFYRKENHPQMFLMTHNNHFFLQVTPNKLRKQHKYFHLIKIQEKSSMRQIENEAEKMKPIYNELWEELKFAYEHDKPIFMWNNMRRILETYSKFVFNMDSISDIEKKVEGSVDQTLVVALIKSLHVNSHVGYNTDVDISGKTKDELKIIFEDTFKSLGADTHFSSYWRT